jgi:hypothetical protein
LRETRLSDITGWLQTLEVFRNTRKCAAPGFLMPYHFVTLGLMLKEVRAGQLMLPPEVASYAARMRLWEAIGLESPVKVSVGPRGTHLHELTPLVDLNKVEDVAIDLSSLVTSHVGKPCSEETASSLYTTLTELLSNCYHHARMEDDLQGLVCAQTWYQGSRAQFAIGDSGIGIRASLSENPDLKKRLESGNACSLALKLGISSKLGDKHSGYGLTVAKDLALQTPGSELMVLSYREAAVAKGRTVTEYTNLKHGVPGTLVVFEWDMKTALDIRRVYASWPKVEEDGDDFF